MQRAVYWLTLSLTVFGLGISGARANDASKPIEIRVGAAAASDHAPAFVALERGIFAKHGLNAKIIMYPTGVEEINGLLSGAQDVNVMGSIPFLAGISHGLPLVLIGHDHGDASKKSYSLGQSIVAGPGSGINGIKDLKGKRIGLPRGTGAEGLLDGVLQAAGLTPNDVTLINLKPAEVTTALAQKSVDAVSIWEPWPSLAVLNVPGSKRIGVNACLGCYYPAALLTSKGIVSEKPEALHRFMAAFSEAQQWVRHHLDQAAEIDMHWIPGIALPVMKEAIRQANFDDRISKYTREMFIAKTIPGLVKAGNLKKVFDPGPWIDPSIVLDVEKRHPEYFSDLPAIPPDAKLQ